MSRSQLAWTDGRWKLYSSNEGKSWELYNLETDPGEQTDLAEQDRDRVKSMAEAARRWAESCRQSDTRSGNQNKAETLREFRYQRLGTSNRPL